MKPASEIQATGVSQSSVSDFDSIESRIDTIWHTGSGQAPLPAALELLQLGERVLENWIVARGEVPTQDTKEGFRLLALHRQGSKGDPSFNACRETCRELAFHYNLIASDVGHPETPKRLQLAAMVAKHLCLFVAGKMQVAGLGVFCCSAKPLRARDASI